MCVEEVLCGLQICFDESQWWCYVSKCYVDSVASPARESMARWLRSANVRSVAFHKVRWFCVVGCGMVPTKGVWCLCISIGLYLYKVCGDYTRTVVNIDARCMKILWMT